MAKGVLVGNQIDTELSTARVQLQYFVSGKRAPVSPNRFVVSIREGVLGVELEFIYLKECEVFNQIQQSLEIGNTATRDIDHHASTGEIRVVLDDDARQATAELQHQLAQGCDGGPQSSLL